MLNTVKPILMSLILSGLTLTAHAKDREYTPGDGTLDFQCKPQNESLQPYSTFSFTLLYDQIAAREKGLMALISDEGLQSGNKDLVYRIDIAQRHSQDSKDALRKMVIPGCAESLIKINQKENGDFSIYFECDSDGDLGYGNLHMSTDAFTVQGNIHFPEGQSRLPLPISDDTSISLICD